jgi:O-antigen ligase/tetratricopeptide (TPR) repeat protein
VSTWCDRITLGGVLFLLLASPLAFGSVHPPAVSLVEVVLFLLIPVWAVRVLTTQSRMEAQGETRPPIAPRPFFLPLFLFVGLVLLQLCPLSPAVLRAVSPPTYELYTHVLPGWPQLMLYNEPLVTHLPAEEPSEWVVLPTPEEVKQKAATPRFSPARAGDADRQTAATTPIHTWRSLSPAPTLTRAALLKLFAYMALFALVAWYPVGRGGRVRQWDAEARFLRAVVLTILFSGGSVALVGIVQCFSWNGGILWFFVPYDWQGAQTAVTPRAQGPFVNPSHFANYLAVTFPLALTAAVFPSTLAPAPVSRMFRLIGGSLSFFLGVGILLSHSRGGWIGLLLGGGIVLWGIAYERATRSPAACPRSRFWLPPLRVVLLSLVVGAGVALAAVGTSARRQMDTRLDETLRGEVSGMTRVALWADTAKMTRDFPLWGVGLGAWSTVFPHYQRPSWAGVYFREAHNDYVELAAETGMIGVGLSTWFFALVAGRLRHGFLAASAKARPLLVAFGGAIGVMTVHEMVDFNLQIPANAVLFTVLVGLGGRLAHREVSEKLGVILSSPRSLPAGPAARANPGGWRRRRHEAGAAAVCGGAGVLIFFALQQGRAPYPYNLRPPTSLSEARASIQTHPAHAPFHLALAQLVPPGAPAVLRQAALEAALWLEPGNPYARDLYAVTLFRRGKKKEGLEQTSLSVFYAPETRAHVYLNPRIVPWLPPEEQAAIEEGLRRALAAGSHGAKAGAGQFYASLGRFLDQARVYENAARSAGRDREKVEWLLQAGRAYSRAKEGRKAEQTLRTAIALAPHDQGPYQQLVSHLLETARDRGAAEAVVAGGIARGVDPFALWLSFSDAARSAGYAAESKEALARALGARPESYEAHVRLGHLYLQERNFDRAALVWRKATALDPSAASAFFHLGVAERGRYRFFEAERAFAHALALQPDDPTFQREYTALRELMEKHTSYPPPHETPDTGTVAISPRTARLR